jgi:heme exporter protein C
MLDWSRQKLLSPKSFYFTTRPFIPWLIIAFIIFFGYGLINGLFISPADYQQGNSVRIMYVHVPSAFAGMMIYFSMACCALITLVWRVKLAAIALSCSAGIGASFTLLALVTGSIWGKPTWGTWWIWDARLTSMLILFFLYLGFISLQSIITDPKSRDKACALIALVGVINLPIIHYSVIWWNTLHQGPSISRFAKPSIDSSMLYPLLAMIAAFFIFYILILIIRMRNQILLREMKTQWVQEVLR